jgi:hypothetical protein
VGPDNLGNQAVIKKICCNFAFSFRPVFLGRKAFGILTTPFVHSSFHFGMAVLAFSIAMVQWEDTANAQKYTPDHPLVQQMINRGMAFLESKSATTDYGNEGETILVGYCAFKVTGDHNHILVKKGVDAAIALARRMAARSFQPDEKLVYVVAVAGMLLPTVDVDAYGEQTKQIRDFLIQRQKPVGGFGYLNGQQAIYGDISQTQYVMLSFWTMSQMGIEVPSDAVERAINFLMAAQDTTGGWPYQFKSPTEKEGMLTNSLASAGLSALLIGGDMLGLYRSKQQDNQEEEGIIPLAFRRVVPEGQRARVNVDRGRIDSSVKRCENWFAANPYTRDVNWHYYYVYSKERYESFLEISRGKQQKSPQWYNDGVQMLMDSQSENGSWGTKPGETMSALSPHLSTSFSILFLIRSTQKAIGDLSEAFNQGVGELPDDVTSIATRGGKIINKNEATSIDDALKMLEDDAKIDGEDALAPDKMLLASDPKQRQDQLNRFVRLLNGKDFKARQIAAKMLGRGDSLDLVPPLIYALTDPDPRVPQFAEQSLRLISRQLDSRHLPIKEKLSEQDKARAATQWKKWFLTIRPDYVFVD